MTGRAFTRRRGKPYRWLLRFHRHFIERWRFLDTHWNFGISGSDGNQMPLQIGLLHLFAGLGALTMVLGRWQGEKETLGDCAPSGVLWACV